MGNLPWHCKHSAERCGTETYLFHEVSTTDHNSRDGFLALAKLSIFVAPCQVGLLEIPRNNKLEFPGTLFPKVVDTRDPASRSVGRRRDGIRMRNTLRQMRILT